MANVLGKARTKTASNNTHEELGHWEADTVVGKRQGRESVVFTMVERITYHGSLYCH